LAEWLGKISWNGTSPFHFLSVASARERRALLASTLGWMLDGMDVTLYAVVIRELLRELHLTSAQAGMLASLTLIASAVGGIFFGILADRAGRRVALMASIAVYSVFTAACGVSHGVVQLAVFRFLVGLGMGGEWATGAALVSESWTAEHRGKALGFMQSGFAVGYALAALIAALVVPRWGWRAVFFVGILPALLTLWIRQGVQESPLWLAQKSGVGSRKSGVGKEESFSRTPKTEPPIPKPEPPAPLQAAEAWRRPFRAAVRTYAKPLLITLLMNSAALFAWWGLFTWIPTYLALPTAQGGRGLSLVSSSAWIAAMQLGMWLGYVTFGYVSDAMGRKKTYIGYLFIAALLVPLYSRAGPATLLAAGPLLAFFGTGHFTGFGIITAEIFPTPIRASAMGLTYNFGRALSAAAPWAIGALAEHGGLSSAFWISGIAFLAAALLALGIPETRGRTLI
jgi:MFS family permease